MGIRSGKYTVEGTAVSRMREKSWLNVSIALSPFYSYICITGHLERKRDCPTCGCPLMRDQIYPNFLCEYSDRRFSYII